MMIRRKTINIMVSETSMIEYRVALWRNFGCSYLFDQNVDLRTHGIMVHENNTDKFKSEDVPPNEPIKEGTTESKACKEEKKENVEEKFTINSTHIRRI